MQADTEGIERIVNEYDGNAKAIRHELLKICWYMRGGITYTEAHMLSPEEREIVSDIVEKNLATTKESGLPFF